jgi:ATP-dependent Clp protease protease subunit
MTRSTSGSAPLGPGELRRPPWLPPAEPPATEPAREPAEAPQGAWLYRQLLERRIVLAQGTLDRELATALCAQLLTLDADGEEPISLHLHTPDGALEAALTMVDALDVLRVSVRATAVGAVGGPCLGVLAAADVRQAYPHATFHLVEPRTRLDGTASEVAAHEAHHRRLLDDFYTRLAQATGKGVEELRADARQGRYLNATEALEYGLIDAIAAQR